MSRLREGTLALAALLGACAAGESAPAPATREASLAGDAGAAERIAAEAGAFRLTHASRLRRVERAALPAGIASRFDATSTHLSPVFARGEIARADVSLPRLSSGRTVVRDRRSGVVASFALVGAADAPASEHGGLLVYPAALGAGRDLVHRPSLVGTEDFVVVHAPTHELAYELDTAGFAGLRLVSGALELLDASGTPRLRMAPPWVVDRRGEVRALEVEVRGCDVDRSALPPRGRAVTPPGAPACTVSLPLARLDLALPALVDPSWTLTAGVLAEARLDHTATRLADGTVLVAGGSTVIYTNPGTTSTEVYDPDTGTFAMGPPLGVGRAHHTATMLLDGRILIVGGNVTSTEFFDGGSFVAGPTLALQRDGHTATLLPDGRVMILGGYDATRSAVLFDPAGPDSLTATGNTIQVRAEHASSALSDGRVLVTGGLYSSPEETAELWNPTTGVWSYTTQMPTPRGYHTNTTLADGRILVAAGLDETYLASSAVEIFVPDAGAGTWAPTPALSPARYWHEDALLSTGAVLLVGGYDDADVPTAVATLYDPVANTYAPTTPMEEARAFFTLTELEDGSFLAVGGEGEAGAKATAEVFLATPVGGPCLTDGDCANGLCFDDVCCEKACDGACEACSAAVKGFGADGECEAVDAGTADALCPDEGEGSCGTTGLCGENGACAVVEEGAACGLRVCADATLTSSACDGLGGCVQSSTPCAPFACADATSCATACTEAEDCGAGAWCTPEGACESKVASGEPCTADEACTSNVCSEAGICSGTGCVDAATLRLPDASLQDCAPYACREGACLVQCGSVLDCAEGSVCDEAGLCTAPVQPAALGGCAVGGAPRGGGEAALAAALVAVALRRRARARARA